MQASAQEAAITRKPRNSSAGGIKRVQAWCWYHPRFKVDLNHCARFGSLSRAIDKTDPPSLSPCPSRLVLVAVLLLPYQPLLHFHSQFPSPPPQWGDWI